MAGRAADERQRRVFPRAEHSPHHQLQEIASLPIPDELLGEIFLRLPTPADLVRASAGCVSFRGVATDRSFLRRFRKLHAPPLLGFLDYYSKVFYPAAPPYPSASAASAFAKAADFSFSFSFLPAPARGWVVQDIRDGRVLLDRFRRRGTKIFPELVVCDPLHRRYLLLPPIPEDLAASVEDPFLISKKRLRVETFLVPTGHSEEAGTEDDTSFRVIWMAQCRTRLVTFIFSSNTGQWRAVPSRRWIDLSADLPPWIKSILFYMRGYACGCFYFSTSTVSELLVLDIKTMEFSVAKPPPEANGCFNFVMVEAGEGRPGMIVVQDDDSSDLSYFIRQNDGGSSSQWQKVKTISLDPSVGLIRNMEKYPLVCQRQEQSSLLELSCSTLDIETFQLEKKVCALGSNDAYELRAYRNFPPFLLSPPTISSGVENRSEKERLEQGCAASSSAAKSPRPE